MLTAQNQSDTLSLITSAKWKPISIINTAGDTLITIDSTDYLSLNKEKEFKYELKTKQMQASGNWELKGKELFFYLNPQVGQTNIDSITEQNIDSASLTRIYTIIKCTNDSLILVEKGITFSFLNKTKIVSKKVVSLESAGFSMNSLFRGILGMLVLIFIAWIFSTNRSAISWKVVLTGLAIQLILAFGVLTVPPIQQFFEFIGKIFVLILDFTMEGTKFLFKSFISGEIEQPLINFAITILPTIIFFSALTSVLFYYGIIQKIVYGMAWIMTKILKLSGAESLSVAGNIFLGQTESPLMIKAYLEKMNKSEILLVMAGGMATLAGGVLAVYIGVLGGSDPVQRLIFAKHLLAASVMAAPGVIVISKILVPQTEKIDTDVKISSDKIGKNVLDAIANGTSEGLKLAVNVAAMLLVFISFIALFNFVFIKIGNWTSLNAVISNFTDGQYNELSLQFILGYTFAPLMWLIGVSGEDITLVGRVLGEKLILTEFIGYVSLGDLKSAGAFAEQKSIIMATYMLCGFANFASIGIQIGGIGSLAPGKRVLLSQFGLRALLAGTLASLMSATIVGMILG
ncbi:MAG: Na+ dependent nucleoside transporter [Bacteroidetes bacterium 4572_117]|nr:MAG: Na+ dependent nucleoside transporter [Bacteroidetes bacterium 4572_117]